MKSLKQIEKQIKRSRIFSSYDLSQRNLNDMFEAYENRHKENVAKGPLIGMAIIAACLLLVAGGILVFQTLQAPKTAEPDELTVAEFEYAINRIKGAAQLLAAADMLARQPGGQEYAKDRYQFVACQYPDLDIGLQANRKYQTLLKGESYND